MHTFLSTLFSKPSLSDCGANGTHCSEADHSSLLHYSPQLSTYRNNSKNQQKHISQPVINLEDVEDVMILPQLFGEYLRKAMNFDRKVSM